MSVNKKFVSSAVALACVLGLSNSAWAAKTLDPKGNEGYDTAAECDAAVKAGTAKFYKSFTFKPPLLRAGEVKVKAMSLGQTSVPANVQAMRNFDARDYTKGACDKGVDSKLGRDGVAKELVGKYVPYSPDMAVNVYYDKAGNPVRISMKQCDNWFDGSWPRPISPVAAIKPTAAAPVITPVVVAPVPAVVPPVVVMPPVAPVAVPVVAAPAGAGAAVASASGGLAPIALGAAALIGVAAALGSTNGSSGTTGTTGSR